MELNSHGLTFLLTAERRFAYNRQVMQDEIAELLGPGGRFARLCPGYEYREEQVAMAQAVADALLHKQHLLVEAGTGVGKTVAYLTPAIMHAVGTRRIVVSTHTINLQSQLVNKDIPMMAEVMEEHPFKAVLMKGRANFVCLREMDHYQAALPYADSEFERLKNWVAQTKTGDLAELDFAFADWAEVCCNVDTCKGQECPYNAERCFYYKMRRDAQTADIIIANHALFFADLNLKTANPREGVLPDYGAVIFDEAHHLEDVATDSFGIEFSNYRIPHLLNRIKKRREIDIQPGELQFIERVNNELFETFGRIDRSEFSFDDLYESEGRSRVENIVADLLTSLDSLNTQLAGQDTAGDKELKDRIDGYKNMVTRMRSELHGVFFGEQPDYFRWAEKPSGSRFVTCYLHYTPVDVAELLRDALWGRTDTVICTSATLSNSGTFCYIKNRLGADETNELILGSPFDFMSQTLLYVPDDLEPPSTSEDYADSVADRIREILLATNGRAFMLFTSYRMMHSVFDRLVNAVPFRLLVQGDMSNERLLKEFREDPQACLMGVHSFWEGVDVKGERLTCVIIDKLPFAVPDTPINKARCERIEREGGNWFAEYAIPQAQIRLKQGFGRLIRTKSDYGVVAILDSRIHAKYYGKEFLKYLPRCRGTKSVSKIRSFLASFEPYDGARFAVTEQ